MSPFGSGEARRLLARQSSAVSPSPERAPISKGMGEGKGEKGKGRGRGTKGAGKGRGKNGKGKGAEAEVEPKEKAPPKRKATEQATLWANFACVVVWRTVQLCWGSKFASAGVANSCVVSLKHEAAATYQVGRDIK